MNPFQSDNIWKKKARQGKAQQHPLTPRQEWQKQVNSSSLWLGGGVVLLALYLAAVRAGTVALDGERELIFEPGQRVGVTLRENAFRTLDVARCMAVAARDGLLRTSPHP